MSKRFLQSRLQAITFLKIYDLVCQHHLSLGQMLFDMMHTNHQAVRHTDFDYGLYRLLDLEIGLTAGVTGAQEMLTPARHLIPPLIYSEIRVRPFFDLYFLQDL
jgi:hypothetical protein